MEDVCAASAMLCKHTFVAWVWALQLCWLKDIRVWTLHLMGACHHENMSDRITSVATWVAEGQEGIHIGLLDGCMTS